MNFSYLISFQLLMFVCVYPAEGQVRLTVGTIGITTDKQAYQPGDTLWLSAQLRETQTRQLDSTSATVYVELLSDENLIVNKALLFGTCGKASGYISLPATTAIGKYRIRAFTRNAISYDMDRISYKPIKVAESGAPVSKDSLPVSSGADISRDSSAYGLMVFKLQLSNSGHGYFSISATDQIPGWTSGFKEPGQDTLMPVANTESGIPISGTVYNLKNKPVVKATLRIMTSNGTVLSGKTDSIGRFYTSQLFHMDSVNVIILAKRKKGEIFDIEIDPFPSFLEPNEIKVDQKVTTAKSQKSSDLPLRTTGRMLNEVIIKSKKDRFDKVRSKLYDKEFGVTTIDMKDMPPGYSNVGNVLRGRIAGVRVDANGSISIRNGGEPLFLIDGMYAERDQVDMLSPFHIAFIDVLKGPETAIFGSRGGGGVIAIYTKTGEMDENNDPTDGGSVQLRYPGYQRPVAFKHSTVPAVAGIPQTWYWEPLLKTDENGVGRFSFPKPDKPGVYWIKAEGFDVNGKHCYAVHKFEIE